VYERRLRTPELLSVRTSLPQLQRIDGIALPLLAIALPALLGLVGFVVNSGQLVLARARLTNTAELVALTALAEYTRAAGTPGQREALALARSRQVLSLNELPSGVVLNEELAAGAAGLEFGWWEGNEASSFVPLQFGADRPADAARITLSATAPFLFPTPFGEHRHHLTVRRTVSLIPRENWIILDTSLSMSRESHLVHPSTDPLAALPVFPASVLTASCGAPATVAEQIWCGLAAERNIGGAPVPLRHFKSDYVRIGEVLVDSRAPSSGRDLADGWQPMGESFRRANLLLQLLKESFSAGDTFRLVTTARFPAPVLPPLTEPAATDPDWLMQITHLPNRGTSDGALRTHPEVHPNAFDANLFAAAPNAQDMTHLNAALAAALEAPTPSTRHRRIFLLTDGMGTCTRNGSCSESWSGYTAARDEFRSTLIPLALSRSNGVARTELFIIPVGAHIGPHLINIASSGFPLLPQTPGRVSLSQAADLLPAAPQGTALFDATPVVDGAFMNFCLSNCGGGCDTECANTYALRFAGRQGILFRDPMSVLGHAGLELARAKRGGLCLLLPPHPQPGTYEDHDGDPKTPAILPESVRPVGLPLMWAPEDMPEAGQLEQCIGFRHDVGIEVVE